MDNSVRELAEVDAVAAFNPTERISGRTIIRI